MDYKTIILEHSDYFSQSNIWTDIIRSIGWGIIKFLTTLSDAAESIFDSAYEMLNFMNSSVFRDFISEFSVFIVPILTISFLAIGVILTFSEKKPPVLKNIAIGLAIIFVMPTIISSLNEGVIAAKNDLLNDSMTNQLVFSNISDLEYIAKNQFNFNSTLADTITDSENGLKAINPAQHVNPKSYDEELQKQVFSNYLDIDIDSGNIVWKQIESKGMFDIFDPPYYYRYNIHFFQLIIFLIANIILFIFCAYAVIRMIYEIITSRILACFHSMELSGGQKTQKIIEYFFQGYIILLCIPIMLKIYLLLQQFINTNVSNGIVRAILILLSALVVCDGPSLIEKIYGYDMGMSHGAQKVMSFMRMVQQSRMQHQMMKNSKNRNNSARRNSLHNLLSPLSDKNNTSNAGAASEPNVNYGNNSNSVNSRTGGGAVSEPNINYGSSSSSAFTSNNPNENISSSNPVDNVSNVNSQKNDNTGSFNNQSSSNSFNGSDSNISSNLSNTNASDKGVSNNMSNNNIRSENMSSDINAGIGNISSNLSSANTSNNETSNNRNSSNSRSGNASQSESSHNSISNNSRNISNSNNNLGDMAQNKSSYSNVSDKGVSNNRNSSNSRSGNMTTNKTPSRNISNKGTNTSKKNSVIKPSKPGTESKNNIVSEIPENTPKSTISGTEKIISQNGKNINSNTINNISNNTNKNLNSKLNISEQRLSQTKFKINNTGEDDEG